MNQGLAMFVIFINGILAMWNKVEKYLFVYKWSESILNDYTDIFFEVIQQNLQVGINSVCKILSWALL